MTDEHLCLSMFSITPTALSLRLTRGGRGDHEGHGQQGSGEPTHLELCGGDSGSTAAHSLRVDLLHYTTPHWPQSGLGMWEWDVGSRRYSGMTWASTFSGPRVLLPMVHHVTERHDDR
ncbi:hypothetical protein E2C01_021711 [Portunus trituberculatus]|uniref:Uncharacterized protein n=1 Tax=Portunus trituberculatus TaxID=210409 RepID=A0A5B7E6W0_PORTR|nr:hypothetical protein [Portunus trituberculatus]